MVDSWARARNVALAVCCTLLSGATWSQAWPDKPIRIIVGFGPGSGADVVARVLAEKLPERLKVPVLVENKEGAGGVIATTAVASAPPDGYTVLLAALSLVISPHMQTPAPYDAVKDFVPIAKVAELPSLMIASPSAPYANLKELIAYAKVNPGKVYYATSGAGSSSHLNVEVIRQATGVTLVAVPYKNNGQALADTLAGTVGFYFLALPSGTPHVQSGKARGLVIGALKRSPKLPNVATIEEELGISGLEIITWYGLLAPAGTPKEIVARLETETARVLEQPETVAKLAAAGIDVSMLPASGFAAMLQKDNARFSKLVRELDLKQ